MNKKIYTLVDLDEVAEKIKNGAVAVIPCDTIYGIVCSAKSESSVSKLYELKSRENKPGTIIASSIEQLVDLGIKKRYLTAVEKFWPGPISVVIPVGLNLPYLHQGKQSLAVRVTDDKKLKKILNKAGPLLTSSANLPAKEPSKNIDKAIEYFGDNIDFYVDGGKLADHKPSTIIRIVDDAIEILRQGDIKINESGRIIK